MKRIICIIFIFVIFCIIHFYGNDRTMCKRYLQIYNWTPISCESIRTINHQDLVDGKKRYHVIFNEVLTQNKKKLTCNKEFIVYRYELEETVFGETLQAYILFSGEEIIDVRVSCAAVFSTQQLKKYGIDADSYQGLNAMDKNIYFPISATVEEIENGLLKSLKNNL